MREANESSTQAVFVARQPIFTRQQQVDAYELLPGCSGRRESDERSGPVILCDFVGGFSGGTRDSILALSSAAMRGD